MRVISLSTMSAAAIIGGLLAMPVTAAELPKTQMKLIGQDTAQVLHRFLEKSFFGDTPSEITKMSNGAVTVESNAVSLAGGNCFQVCASAESTITAGQNCYFAVITVIEFPKSAGEQFCGWSIHSISFFRSVDGDNADFISSFDNNVFH